MLGIPYRHAPRMQGIPYRHAPRMQGICPPVSGRWSSKARSQGAASHPLLRSWRTAGLLTATVLQPAARDSVATLLLWAEGGYEKPGKTCLPSLFQRRVATLFRTISSHSEQSPLSFRAQSRNLSRHSTACPAPAAIEPSFHGLVRGICFPRGLQLNNRK